MLESYRSNSHLSRNRHMVILPKTCGLCKHCNSHTGWSSESGCWSEPTEDLAGMGLFFAFLSLKGASCAYSRRYASLLRATEWKNSPIPARS